MINQKDLDNIDGSDNTPGLQQYVYAVPMVGVLTDNANWPDVTQKDPTATGEFEDLVTIEGDLKLKPGYKMIRIYGTLETLELKSEVQGELDGKSFKNILEFLHPGSKAEVEGFRRWAKNSSLLFIVHEADGQRRLLGHPGFPAKLETNPGTTGKASADRKSSTFTFYSVWSGPAPFFNGRVMKTGSIGGEEEQELIYLD